MQALLDPTRETLDLADLWCALKQGRAFVTETSCRESRCFVTLSSSPKDRRSPRAHEWAALERILSGELGKVVAIELGKSPASVSFQCSKVLRSLAAETLVSRVSIAVVMAALCARGWRLPLARIDNRMETGALVSFELPGRCLMARLPAVEADVLRMTIEGKSHAEIAASRGTSPRTVANQLGTIFRKLGVSGRAALRARAVEEHSREWTAQARSGTGLNGARRQQLASRRIG